MERYYSKQEPTKLLHIINRLTDITTPRNNVIPENHFLQLATMKLNDGQTGGN